MIKSIVLISFLISFSVTASAGEFYTLAKIESAKAECITSELELDNQTFTECFASVNFWLPCNAHAIGIVEQVIGKNQQDLLVGVSISVNEEDTCLALPELAYARSAYRNSKTFDVKVLAAATSDE